MKTPLVLSPSGEKLKFLVGWYSVLEFLLIYCNANSIKLRWLVVVPVHDVMPKNRNTALQRANDIPGKLPE